MKSSNIYAVDFLLQQSNYYDLSAFSGVPSSVAPGRDQAAALGTAPFTGKTLCISGYTAWHCCSVSACWLAVTNTLSESGIRRENEDSCGNENRIAGKNVFRGGKLTSILFFL